MKKINKFRSDYGRMNLHDRDILRMEKKETARNMLAEGISVEVIVKCTKLSLNEVTKLQAEMTETA